MKKGLVEWSIVILACFLFLVEFFYIYNMTHNTDSMRDLIEYLEEENRNLHTEVSRLRGETPK